METAQRKNSFDFVAERGGGFRKKWELDVELGVEEGWGEEVVQESLKERA